MSVRSQRLVKYGIVEPQADLINNAIGECRTSQLKSGATKPIGWERRNSEPRLNYLQQSLANCSNILN
ncbi:hypothetical protein VCRA2116O29_890004 [Vibrio crassostreae]|nr:hypothetical protein EDB37_10774 [Vibrio crassostreae]CAK2554970.1 hypothetical protein VCRA2116O29_890004 [Vibrio crassostreae]CAK2572520.1 hypothetical protein VCRA2119O48_840004 [Vibrio crassostreae]